MQMIEHIYIVTFKSILEYFLLRIQGTVQQISNGDLLRPMRIECWDYDRGGGHDFIGSCSASIADMQVMTQL